MKSGTRLDSAFFQLTPTRTRYDLVITANGKTEKIASGLLNPFLAHLKTAQDQIDKGGYSIMLKPDTDAAWFIKGTIERFVRFVSTPEVLERVNTIESEILQIEEAINIQGNNNLGSNLMEMRQRKTEDQAMRLMESIEGNKLLLDDESEKAIVLYKPGAQIPESNGTATEENSRVQLLKVLDARKIVLRKEQGMAFARAVAAGFDIDHVAHLISFAECFGALRLLEACLKYLELWREKHETGQWLEIEAAEALSSRSDFSSPNVESSRKVDDEDSADKRLSTGTPLSQDHHEHFHGQLQHPMYLQWPMHVPPGTPQVFPTYPMQGMSYYPNYPGNGPFSHPPYPSTEETRLNTAERNGLQRQPMDYKESNTESEKEGSQCRETRIKADRSGKNKSRMVVIRNINYITSKRKNSLDSESESASDFDSNEDVEDLQGDTPKINHKGSVRRSASEGNRVKPSNFGKLCDEDGGNWQAFQKCLLRDDEDNTHPIDQDMFSMEKMASNVLKQNIGKGQDPIVPRGLDFSEVQERSPEFDQITGKMTRVWDTDEIIISGRDKEYRSSQVNNNLSKVEGAKGRYKSGSNDDSIFYRNKNGNGLVISQNKFENFPDNLENSSSQNATDESFIVPLRSTSQYQIDSDTRSVVHMDAEFPRRLQNKEDMSTKNRCEISYEPEDLSLASNCGVERESAGYDPALEYETCDIAKDKIVTRVTEESNELSKDKNSKVVRNILEKNKKDGAMRKGRPSKLSPSNEAQARAGKLRAFKADLQKLKKEREEEDRQRIEALKRERQKRIAAKGSSNLSVPPQARPLTRTKISPSSQKASKFSDSEPGISSPLQRLPIKIASRCSEDSQKTVEPRKLNKGGNFSGNRLTRSVSSLHEIKREKGVKPETKAVTSRIKRLSEPKTSNHNYGSLGRFRSLDPVPVKKASRVPEIQKISAIMSLDRTKAETLPELKIRTSTRPSDLVQTKPSKFTEITDNKLKISHEKTSQGSNEDVNPVIEKTGLMRESEITPTFIPGTQERMDTEKVLYEEVKGGKKIGTSEYVNIYAPGTTYIADNPSQLSTIQLEEQFNFQKELKSDYPVDSTKFSSVRIPEKVYKAPYARTSSLEYPSTNTNSEYTKLHPANSEPATIGAEGCKKVDPSTQYSGEKPRGNVPYARTSSLGYPSTITNSECTKSSPTNSNTARVSAEDRIKLDSFEKYSDEKQQGKEPCKGFKRLLKVGKKNASFHAEHDLEAEKPANNGSVDDHAAINVSNEVHTLKNLISQDETPTASTSQKGTRHFSLLSPFRKSSEKKQTT